MEQEKVFLLSIIYQLMDCGPDVSGLNPHIQNYLKGLQEEFDPEDPQEGEFYKMLYHYADTWFNNEYNKEKMH